MLPWMQGTWRTTAAICLTILAAAAAVLMLLPVPTMPLWLAHLATLEFSLVVSAVAATALLLARPASEGVRRRVFSFAAPALLAGLAPAVSVAPLYASRGASFSPVQYVRGIDGPSEPDVRDRPLDASLPGLTADVYRGAGPGPRPFVVVVHGGGWRGGDKGEVAWTSRAIAASGVSVVDVRYRLSPGVRFPVAVGDVKCWLGRVRERAAELGVDPRRAALLGRSAGGQIALLAAYSFGDPRVPPTCATEDAPVEAVVSLYGPTDLAWGYEHPSRPDVVRGPAALRSHLGGAPAERSEAYRLGSPQSWVGGRTLPRTLLVHGALDRMVSVEHSRRLARALHEAGASVDLLEVPLAEHAFDVRPGGLGEQLARGVILRFLAGL
jgi:acetyl esterase/lipase